MKKISLLFFLFSFFSTNALSQSLEDLQNKINLYRSQERWVKAAEAYKAFLDRSLDVDRQRQVEEAAEIFFKARDYKEAARYYQMLADRPENQNDPKIIDKLTSSYSRSSQFDLALENLNKLYTLPGQNIATLDYRKIFILYDGSRCEEAIKAIDSYQASYPKSSKIDEALWMKAFCYNVLKKNSHALATLDEIQGSYPKAEARVLFWKSRWGKSANARKNLLAMNDNFYNLWEAQKRNLDANSCLRVPPPFSTPLSSASKSKKHQNLRWQQNHVALSDEELELVFKNQEKEIAKVKNTSYTNWVEGISKVRGIPPALVYGITYQESRFNPKAISPARALGLMQMIPETGYEVADDLRLKDFHFEDLMDPWLNSKFGITYLAILLDQFSGNLIHTIAAYNAGPNAVSRWIELRKGQSCEEWMDQIPFRETYNYVQKVLTAMWRYEQSKPEVAFKD